MRCSSWRWDGKWHPLGHPDSIIQVRDLRNAFDRTWCMMALIWTRTSEILGVVGGSGTGKSVLLRSIVGFNARKGKSTSSDKTSWRCPCASVPRLSAGLCAVSKWRAVFIAHAIENIAAREHSGLVGPTQSTLCMKLL